MRLIGYPAFFNFALESSVNGLMRSVSKFSSAKHCLFWRQWARSIYRVDAVLTGYCFALAYVQLAMGMSWANLMTDSGSRSCMQTLGECRV